MKMYLRALFVLEYPQLRSSTCSSAEEAVPVEKLDYGATITPYSLLTMDFSLDTGWWYFAPRCIIVLHTFWMF